jgi:polynucleotide 5'-kinase involved in rRNA processing
LLGFLDEAGHTVGIGILQRIDFAYHRLEVLTAEGIEGIRGVHWSRTRMGQMVTSITRFPRRDSHVIPLTEPGAVLDSKGLSHWQSHW